MGHGSPCPLLTTLDIAEEEGTMAIPVTSIGGAGAQPLQDADRKHPDYGFILALVCLALGLVVASVIFTPVSGSESLFVGP
jgi:hypothetical protein